MKVNNNNNNVYKTWLQSDLKIYGVALSSKKNDH